MNEKNQKVWREKILSPMNGFVALFIILALWVLSIGGFVFALVNGNTTLIIWSTVWSTVAMIVAIIAMCGLKVINPNEAGVYVLFGNYYGTIAKPGFFYINPFCSLVSPKVSAVGLSQKISLKATTLDNNKQKINDRSGNPIEIGVIVIWRVVNATSAVFEVDNYHTYVSIQCDAALRNVARKYPYDGSEDEEKSLRSSSGEVADELKRELQGRVDLAGIEILETRISHLAYAQEIAAAMLQRQQAEAVIVAKQKIVEGATDMVEMAINKLSERGVVSLDDERRAAMVSNLLVVLCGGKDAQPIVNSGSIY